jgi:uncharacterized protein (DUF2164 family)
MSLKLVLSLLITVGCYIRRKATKLRGQELNKIDSEVLLTFISHALGPRKSAQKVKARSG